MDDISRYYEILGVSEKATTREIRQAYLGIVSKYHPDHNPDDKTAERVTREANEAYAFLKDIRSDGGRTNRSSRRSSTSYEEPEWDDEWEDEEDEWNEDEWEEDEWEEDARSSTAYESSYEWEEPVGPRDHAREKGELIEPPDRHSLVGRLRDYKWVPIRKRLYRACLRARGWRKVPWGLALGLFMIYRATLCVVMAPVCAGIWGVGLALRLIGGLAGVVFIGGGVLMDFAVVWGAMFFGWIATMGWGMLIGLALIGGCLTLIGLALIYIPYIVPSINNLMIRVIYGLGEDARDALEEIG